MSSKYAHLARALAHVQFYEASWERSFIHDDMRYAANTPPTEDQRRMLRLLVQKYRAQLPADVVALARELDD